MLDSWILDVLDVQISEIVISSYIMLYHVIYIYPIYGKLGHPLASQRTRGFFHLFAPTNGESTAHVGIHRKDEGIRLVQLLSAGFLRNLRFQWEVSWGETGGNMTWRNAVSCLLKVLNCFSLYFFSWWGTAHPEMAFWLQIPATSWRIQSAMALAQNRLASYMENGQPMTYTPGVAGVYQEFVFSSFSHHHHGAQPRIKSDTYCF